MKKINTRIAITLMLMLSMSTTAFASVTTLWEATDNTYVKSEHGDNYFEDQYHGTAAVRGADRDLNSENRNIYYRWTKVTYDVQGDISSKTAYSANKNDTRSIVQTITVDDKWNIGSKTKVYYNYAASIADGNLGYSNNNTEVIYGGLLEAGEESEHGAIFEKN